MDQVNRRRIFTIDFEVTDIGTDISDDAIRRAMESIRDDWRDGRHPFCVELLQKGVTDLVKGAIHAAVWTKVSEENPSPAMIPSKDGSCHTNENVFRASKATKGLWVECVSINDVRVRTKYRELYQETEYEEV